MTESELLALFQTYHRENREDHGKIFGELKELGKVQAEMMGTVAGQINTLKAVDKAQCDKLKLTWAIGGGITLTIIGILVKVMMGG